MGYNQEAFLQNNREPLQLCAVCGGKHNNP